MFDNATGGPVAITVVAPAANSYEAAIVADAPESWWRLDESSGTTMYDAMGRHDGSYANLSGNPVTMGVPGALAFSSDQAISLDGSRSFGQVPYTPALNGSTFSLECWAKTTVLNETLCPVSSRANTKGEWFWTYPAGQWSGGVAQSGNNYYVPSSVLPDAIQSDQWTHLVISYGAGSLRVYVNGQWDGGGYVNFERNGAGPLIIGARGVTVAPTVDEMFKGQIDEVAYYPTQLSPAQALAHYQAARYGTTTRPVFRIQPQSQTVVVSNNVSFVSLVEGSLPISLRWYKDGTPIANATNSTLTLNNVQFAAIGTYQLWATNSAGFSNSAPATLTVASV